MKAGCPSVTQRTSAKRTAALGSTNSSLTTLSAHRSAAGPVVKVTIHNGGQLALEAAVLVERESCASRALAARDAARPKRSLSCSAHR